MALFPNIWTYPDFPVWYNPEESRKDKNNMEPIQLLSFELDDVA